MKIASVCRAYGNGGGMENVVDDRAVALREAGHEVVIVHAADGKYSDDFAAKCVSECDRFAPDIIHLDSFDGDRPWWVDRGERVALTVHSTPWSSYFTKWNAWRHDRGKEPGLFFKLIAQQCDIMAKADVVIAMNRYEHECLRDRCGLLAAKLVYNPIAPYFFEGPIAPVPADGYFLHIGNQVVRGYIEFVQACHAAGVEHHIASGVARRDMPAVYAGCKALVLPTYRADGYDLTVAEANACGRTAIVGATGPYLAECGGGIEATPLGDPQALADRLAGEFETQDIYEASRHEPGYHAHEWLEAVA